MMKPEPVAAMQNAAKLRASAEACAERRDWRSADELFRQALSLDPSPCSRIAYGVCLAGQERYFESISVFTPILDTDDRPAIGVVCHNLAAIYREVGDLDLARRFQWRATLMQEESTAEDLLGLANDALMSGQPELAASLAMSACDMASEDVDDCTDGDLIATTGLIKAALDATEDGLVTLFAAYRRHQSVQDYRGMGADLMNMAMLFGELNRHRAGRNCLLRAIRCFERAPAPHSCHRARQHLQQFEQMHSVRSFDVRRN